MVMPSPNQRPQQRTQVLDRPVANTAQYIDVNNAGAGFANIAKVFDAFAKKEAEDAEELELIKDQEALDKHFTDIANNPELAKNSSRTGDWSWSDISARMHRPSIQKLFGAYTGKAMGISIANDAKVAMQSMDPTADPDEWLQKYTQEQLGGIKNGSIQRAVFEAVQKGTLKELAEVRQRKSDIFNAQVMNSVRRTIDAQITEGATIAQLMDTAKTAVGGMQGSAGENMETLKSHIVSQAVWLSKAGTMNQQTAAAALLSQSHPAFGGPLLSSFDPVQLEKLRNAANSARLHRTDADAVAHWQRVEMQMATASTAKEKAEILNAGLKAGGAVGATAEDSEYGKLFKGVWTLRHAEAKAAKTASGSSTPTSLNAANDTIELVMGKMENNTATPDDYKAALYAYANAGDGVKSDYKRRFRNMLHRGDATSRQAFIALNGAAQTFTGLNNIDIVDMVGNDTATLAMIAYLNTHDISTDGKFKEHHSYYKKNFAPQLSQSAAGAAKTFYKMRTPDYKGIPGHTVLQDDDTRAAIEKAWDIPAGTLTKNPGLQIVNLLTQRLDYVAAGIGNIEGATTETLHREVLRFIGRPNLQVEQLEGGMTRLVIVNAEVPEPPGGTPAPPQASAGDAAENAENASGETQLKVPTTAQARAEEAFNLALAARGLHEVADGDALNKYLQQSKLWHKQMNPEDTYWCAAFVNASLASAGLKASGSLIANSYMTWGTEGSLKTLAKGDVLVQHRGKGAGVMGGHVGIASGRQKTMNGQVYVEMMGGNSSNKVKRQWKPASALMFRKAGPDQVLSGNNPAWPMGTAQGTGLPRPPVAKLPNGTGVTQSGQRVRAKHVNLTRDEFEGTVGRGVGQTDLRADGTFALSVTDPSTSRAGAFSVPADNPWEVPNNTMVNHLIAGGMYTFSDNPDDVGKPGVIVRYPREGSFQFYAPLLTKAYESGKRVARTFSPAAAIMDSLGLSFDDSEDSYRYVAGPLPKGSSGETHQITKDGALFFESDGEEWEIRGVSSLLKVRPENNSVIANKFTGFLNKLGLNDKGEVLKVPLAQLIAKAARQEPNASTQDKRPESVSAHLGSFPPSIDKVIEETTNALESSGNFEDAAKVQAAYDELKEELADPSLTTSPPAEDAPDQLQDGQSNEEIEEEKRALTEHVQSLVDAGLAHPSAVDLVETEGKNAVDKANSETNFVPNKEATAMNAVKAIQAANPAESWKPEKISPYLGKSKMSRANNPMGLRDVDGDLLEMSNIQEGILVGAGQYLDMYDQGRYTVRDLLAAAPLNEVKIVARHVGKDPEEAINLKEPEVLIKFMQGVAEANLGTDEGRTWKPYIRDAVEGKEVKLPNEGTGDQVLGNGYRFDWPMSEAEMHTAGVKDIEKVTPEQSAMLTQLRVQTILENMPRWIPGANLNQPRREALIQYLYDSPWKFPKTALSADPEAPAEPVQPKDRPRKYQFLTKAQIDALTPAEKEVFDTEVKAAEAKASGRKYQFLNSAQIKALQPAEMDVLDSASPEERPEVERQLERKYSHLNKATVDALTPAETDVLNTVVPPGQPGEPEEPSKRQYQFLNKSQIDALQPGPTDEESLFNMKLGTAIKTEVKQAIRKYQFLNPSQVNALRPSDPKAPEGQPAFLTKELVEAIQEGDHDKVAKLIKRETRIFNRNMSGPQKAALRFYIKTVRDSLAIKYRGR